MYKYELENMTGAKLLDLAKRIQLGYNPLVEMIEEVNTLDAETGEGDLYTLYMRNIEDLERNINLNTTYNVQIIKMYNNEDYNPGVYETTYIFADIYRD